MSPVLQRPGSSWGDPSDHPLRYVLALLSLQELRKLAVQHGVPTSLAHHHSQPRPHTTLPADPAGVAGREELTTRLLAHARGQRSIVDFATSRPTRETGTFAAPTAGVGVEGSLLEAAMRMIGRVSLFDCRSNEDSSFLCYLLVVCYFRRTYCGSNPRVACRLCSPDAAILPVVGPAGRLAILRQLTAAASGENVAFPASTAGIAHGAL